MPDSLRPRKANRLSYWDYGRPGWYFLTLCCASRECLFGEVVADEMRLSEFGRIAQHCLEQSAQIRAELRLDCSVVMPNHIHLVAVLGGLDNGQLGCSRRPGQLEPRSASSFVAGYKSAVTAAINTLRGTPGQPVWQRSFHDHIIRSEAALSAIRLYIQHNPRQWLLDRHHPRAADNAGEALDRMLAADARRPLPGGP